MEDLETILPVIVLVTVLTFIGAFMGIQSITEQCDEEHQFEFFGTTYICVPAKEDLERP